MRRKSRSGIEYMSLVRKMNNKKSFTLIELLVVIVILGILASLLAGNFFTSLKKGRDARRKADLEQVQRALEIYYEDKRAYPTQAPGSGFVFNGEFSDQVNGKVYMKKVSTDPIGQNSYKYESDSNGSYYKLYACLENDQQILPYLSNPSNFVCNIQCKDVDNNNVACIWGVSSPNITP